jgi:hypothetical protein
MERTHPNRLALQKAPLREPLFRGTYFLMAAQLPALKQAID